MQQALGAQWADLPRGLQAHYENDAQGQNIAHGLLTIDYPKWMQWPLNMMHLVGVLANKKGKHLPTTVVRTMQGERQFWHRHIRFPDNKTIQFTSQLSFKPKQNEFIEYTRSFLSIRMKVHVDAGHLYYESCGYQFEMLGLKIPISETLSLGHASIVESAENDEEFVMDFRLNHPFFGELFRYAGRFRTTSNRPPKDKR